jgi:hypothetical protein
VSLPYQYTVDSEVLEIFAALPKRQRDKLLDIFRRLCADPFIAGDLTHTDHVGRVCQVKRFGEWLVTFWPEHLASELHVIAIQHLRA